jgi:pilus assembly protein TadC
MTLTPAVLGAAWGLLVLAAAGRAHARLAARRRARALARAIPRGERRRARRRHAAGPFRLPGPVERVRELVRTATLAREARRADARVARHLPVAVDLLTVAIGAGLTPYLAVERSVRWVPPPVADALREGLRLTHLGLPFVHALDAAGMACAPLRPVTTVLAASASTGAPAAEPLARLAADAREEMRRRASEHARALSVRLLFPLVFLVLPAFALLVVVPTLLDGLGALGP